MKTIIVILCIYSFNYAAHLNIQIIPDTIYVGTLANIIISVHDLKEGEFPIFSEIDEQPNIYSLVERTLSNNSADYVLQIWESGLISIPSIEINIMRYNQDILNMHSNIIEIPVISNINKNNSVLRDIKPMLDLRIMSTYKIILYILIFIIGISFCLYFLKSRKNNRMQHREIFVYKQSIFQETLQSLKSLEIPQIINMQTTEKYYQELSHIFRIFINEEYFIRATEMTSEELKIYFQSININHKLINTWDHTNKIADMAKYAGQIPAMEQFNKDKKDINHIIKSFHRIKL